MAPKRTSHYIANRRLEIAAGVALFVGGSLLIRDAYDNRGRELPRLLRPFSWW